MLAESFGCRPGQDCCQRGTIVKLLRDTQELLERRYVVKLCVERMKRRDGQDGTTTLAIRFREVNDLTVNEFVYMVLDWMVNCGMKLLADHVVDLV